MTPGSISEDAFQQMLPDNHPFKHVVLQAQEGVARACEKHLKDLGYEKKSDEDYDTWHKRLNDIDSDSTGAEGYRTKYLKTDFETPKWETDTRVYKDGYPLGPREEKQESRVEEVIYKTSAFGPGFYIENPTLPPWPKNIFDPKVSVGQTKFEEEDNSFEQDRDTFDPEVSAGPQVSFIGFGGADRGNGQLAEETREDPFERQVGGDHYKDFKIQPAIFCESNELSFFPSSIVKYACRFKQKGGEEDLKKIIHYAEMALEFYYPKEKFYPK